MCERGLSFVLKYETDSHLTPSLLANRIFMTRLFLILAVLISTNISAQKTTFGIGLGSGKFPIEEDLDPNVNITFDMPVSFTSNFSYIQENGVGLSLKLHYMESRAIGNNWLTNDTVDGYVNSTTFYTLFTKKWKQKKIQSGMDIGPGYSLENYLRQPETYPKRSNYLNLLIGYNATYTFNENCALRLEPNLIFTDLAKGIGYMTGKWNGQSVGEDVSFILNVVFEFNLTKNP